MKFPTVNHISDLLPYIEANAQFRVAVQPNGHTVVCYMLQDEDTFRGEHEEWYKECRGITFDAHGKVSSRTLHKFQNIGENAQTQPDQIPWDRIVRVMAKRDGSMITPVLLQDGSVVCKTKKTFTSSEAVAATELLCADPQRVDWVRAILSAGMTPTFEWTSPRFPIVVLYKKDELTLLHIRENVTGRYLTEGEIEYWMPTFRPDMFPVVENVMDKFSSGGLVMYEYFQREQLTCEGVEGWIIQADDGQMWKVKTKWYCDLHHAVTFTRWRDIARSVLADESDDLKGAFTLTGRDIASIVKVENDIREYIAVVKADVAQIVERCKFLGYTVKDAAITMKAHEMFAQIMRVFKDQEVDWTEWYTRNRLKMHWGLEVVGHVTEDMEVPEGEV